MKKVFKRIGTVLAMAALIITMLPAMKAQAKAAYEWGPFTITNGYVKTMTFDDYAVETWFVDLLNTDPAFNSTVIVVNKDFTFDIDYARMGWDKSDFDFKMNIANDNWDWDGKYPPYVGEMSFDIWEDELSFSDGGFGSLDYVDNTTVHMGERLEALDPNNEVWTSVWYEDGYTYAQRTVFFVTAENKVRNQSCSLYFIFDFQNAGDNFILNLTEGAPLNTVNYVSIPPADPAGTIYRLYNPANGDHIYTTSVEERNSMLKDNWELENSPGISAGKNGTPVYRLSNPASGEHLFSSDKNECKQLVNKFGWQYDNGGEPVFYGSKEGKSFFRLFNPNATSAIDSHHFTSDENEIKVLTNKNGWQVDNDGKPVFSL